jgi:transcriptional regulator with XRE-family HTH domain
MTDFSTAALAYVRHVLRETNMSATALAKRAGISQTTLTRALNDRRHKFSLSVRTLEKVYRASGISPARFLGPADWVDQNKRPPMLALFAEPENIYGQQVARRTDGTMIAGGVAAGEWREISILNFAGTGRVNLSHTFYRDEECFACLVQDDSLNKRAQPGEYLYCIRLNAFKKPLQSGNLVIVERRSDDDLKIELTARELAPMNDGWVLSFATTNKRLREVLKLTDLNSPRVRVIGLADYAFRPLSPYRRT